MSPTDPRHATIAGHSAGCREPCCGAAKLRYDKRRRWDRAQGRPRTIDATGTARRVRALQAIGYSFRQIAGLSGVPERALHHPHYRGATVYIGTAAAVRVTYDRICMAPMNGPYAERNRRLAARNGWAPPLAWDDDTIDDPTARPEGLPLERLTLTERNIAVQDQRLADLNHAVELGHTLVRVAADLGISPSSIGRWCQRNDRRDLYEAISVRTRGASNGTAERGAA